MVSMALLGYGVSGSFLMLFPSVLKKDIYTVLSYCSIFFAISSLLSYSITNTIAFDPVKIAWDPLQIAYIFIYYILLSIPFFFSGMTISIAISRLSERVHRIYFYDLLGAGSGCILALLISSLFGVSNTITIASILGISASAIFYTAKERYGFPYRFFLIAIPLSIIFLFPSFMEITISPYKGLPVSLRYPEAEIVKTRWDSFSRIDVVKSGAVKFAPGLSLKFQGELPEQIGIAIDGGTLTSITKFNGDKKELLFTDYLPSAIPYYLTKTDDILIFDPRGGLEILSAIYHGGRQIESVEFYPLIIDTVRKDYGAFSGGIYSRKNVRVAVGDTRTFIRQSQNRYDIIQITPGDILSASSTGIYGLTEDYRFTVEGFKDYIKHLNENGVLTITLYLLPPPRYELRIISTAIKALEEMGIQSPDSHIAVIRTWGTITIIIKRNGLDSADINGIKDFCRDRHFDIDYYSGIGMEETNRYNRFQEPLYFNLISKIMNSSERERLFEDYVFDITPVTDNRPFFYHFFKWDTFREAYNIFGRKWQPFLEGGYLIPVVFIQALIVSIIFIILPLLFSKGIKTMQSPIPEKKGGDKGWLTDIFFLFYFLLIGIGFMFVEISMIQKFILFLGHPVYSISTVLFTLLVSSGMGSYLSGKLWQEEKWIINIMLLILCSMIIIYAIFLPDIFNNPAFGKWKIAWRQSLSFILLFPLGFFMGMPFPAGIKLLEKHNSRIIPWAWCVNGCSSVLSSVLVILIALSFGFKAALFLSALAYAGGLLIFFLIFRGQSFLYLFCLYFLFL
ncbi:MAG: hypothetical protein A3I04_06965 [Nitrospinae bacterium RIFCSPLOWO2_02_FULL_39_110]|nr:MAG: hypothetical protein A2W53_02585 [Nitrospinae bacterium RIFCSPHIGHO2_02_39_11]OGV98667.1 MAG: hypothetical protein A3D97_02820 [Nitrospinae bacterium RIFCSPHIGHO2_12_FULL_39_42]OGW01032.1 MAG: hypothetical protein A3D20_07260 [Nitrospinae bacterium RIFCSPHIGHO2_02_FULL_39_82]OGW02450.1 MAG: hypothetical protein A2Z59_01095 [Nitrospinae bacterium RIFCSPLOWO2_02_39_17]OGW05790.1 MAG: hypothetical protein A3I04_06965 [Nitrospinae bacterium RIFCSPLOWO2_02_FULL_39_110]OGW08753.1 MAG: hypoth